MKILPVLFRSSLLLFGLSLLSLAARGQTWSNLPASPITETLYTFTFNTGSVTHGTSIYLFAQAPGSSSWIGCGSGGGPAGTFPISLNGNITFVVPGTWIIKAVNGTTSGASTLSQTSLAVSPKITPTTFTFSNLSFTYDGNPKTASVTTSASGATYTSDLTKGPAAGTYTVTATANGVYSGSGSATLTISQASQSTVSLSPASQTVGIGTTLSFTASGGGAGGYNWSGYASGTGSTKSVTFGTLGSFSVTVQSPGDGNYYASNSVTVNISVVDVQAPTVPTALGSSGITATGFNFNWSASTDNVGVTAYEVSRNGISLGTTTATSLAVSGLAQGTTYAMAVRAGDAAGNWSAWSGPLSVATIDTQAPTVPTGLNATSVTLSSFVLNWPASTDNLGVTAYEVFRNGVSQGTTTGLSLTQSTLSPNTTYAMTVRARDLAGNWSVPSTALSVATLADTTGPSLPTGLSASDITASSFTLNWLASTDNVGVTGYEVFRNGVSQGTTGSLSKSLTGLSPGTTYTMTARARDAAGNWSGLSAVLPVTTSTDTSAPSIPTNLASSSVTASSFTLSWSAATDNIGVTGYKVFRGTTLVGTTASTSLAVTGLSPNTLFAMTVQARDAANNWSASSTVLNVTTSVDTSAPSVPSGLVATAIVNAGFTLNWTASTDNAAVTGYKIYRGGALVGTSATTNYVLTGLFPNTAYSVTVQAGDAAGNWSAQSSSLPVTTANNPATDSDNDGVPDLTEIRLGTNPNVARQADSGNTTALKVNKP